MTQKVAKGAYLEGNFISTSFNEKEKDFLSVDGLKPPLKFQIENILGAIAVTSLLNVTKDDVANVATNFKGLDHRVELVRTVHGVDFINDSKGTNVGALHKSLENFSRPIILIAGGKDKGGDFQTLKIPFKKKVKHLVLIGETKNKFREVLNGSFSYEEAENMEDAVERAMKKARSGDIVLLSPGCSSFDMFVDFNDRGNQFKKIVSRL